MPLSITKAGLEALLVPVKNTAVSCTKLGFYVLSTATYTRSEFVTKIGTNILSSYPLTTKIQYNPLLVTKVGFYVLSSVPYYY